MKKIVIMMLLAFFVFSLSALTVVEDRIGLLSEGEKEYVRTSLDKASTESGLSLGVLITNGTDGKSDAAFADDFYDSVILDEDGVLLFLNYGERSVYISTTGYGMYAVDDSGEEIVFDAMMPSLQRGEWAEAFSVFAISVSELSKEYTHSAYENTTYDINTGNFIEEKSNEKHFDWALVVFSFLLPSIPAGFITVYILKKKLKSEGLVGNAEDYVVASSFVLENSRDIYLYSTLSKVPRPQNNGGGSSISRSSGGHISSSGSVHGGGGRRF